MAKTNALYGGYQQQHEFSELSPDAVLTYEDDIAAFDLEDEETPVKAALGLEPILESYDQVLDRLGKILLAVFVIELVFLCVPCFVF